MTWETWGHQGGVQKVKKSARKPNLPLSKHRPSCWPHCLDSSAVRRAITRSQLCVSGGISADPMLGKASGIPCDRRDQDVSQHFSENDSRGVFVFRNISCTFHLSFEDYFCSVKQFKKWQTGALAHIQERRKHKVMGRSWDSICFIEWSWNTVTRGQSDA